MDYNLKLHLTFMKTKLVFNGVFQEIYEAIFCKHGFIPDIKKLYIQYLIYQIPVTYRYVM